jgi:uncharacterized protein YdeI (YjbR/CyaY-like superfamily)
MPALACPSLNGNATLEDEAGVACRTMSDQHIRVCHALSLASMTTPRYFDTASEFRDWLQVNHATATELLVGFRKAHLKDRGLMYAQALDAALCFGWIDGVRRSLGDEAWSIRFTPRRRGSNWSMVNIRRMRELLADGVVAPAGKKAFDVRDEKKSASYSYEQRTKGFDAVHEAELQRHRAAYAFFQSLPPSYRNAASWWVMSAKRDDTRARRMQTLIEISSRGERLSQLIPPSKRAAATRPAATRPAATRPAATRPEGKRSTPKSLKRT